MPIVGEVIRVVHGGPMSRIAPLVSTMPLRASDRATSTLAVPRGTTLPMKSPTRLSESTWQALSMRPGWIVSSPVVALPERARMWLLLMMCRAPLYMTAEPRVPPQQNALPMSLALPPEVPSLIGGVCLT